MLAPSSFALLCALLVDAAPPTAPSYDSAFWQAWGDGKAELDGYALTRMRYGEQRTGTVVAIFVTEPWSASLRVKAEKPDHAKDDVIQALKLNLVEDFQTGIYDYNLMTSSWTALTSSPLSASPPLGTASKVAFSAQEWCGTTYAQVDFDGAHANEIVRSYFDGESGADSLDDRARGGIVEDALLVWARGLASPVVARGASAEVPFLPALARSRLLHTKLAWRTAKLSRDAALVDVDVPAGHFSCEVARVDVAAGTGSDAERRTIAMWVEAAAPHRIVKLVASDGYALELTGSLRTPYWTEHREGDERLLQQLGLHPPRSR